MINMAKSRIQDIPIETQIMHAAKAFVEAYRENQPGLDGHLKALTQAVLHKQELERQGIEVPISLGGRFTVIHAENYVKECAWGMYSENEEAKQAAFKQLCLAVKLFQKLEFRRELLAAELKAEAKASGVGVEEDEAESLV